VKSSFVFINTVLISIWYIRNKINVMVEAMTLYNSYCRWLYEYTETAAVEGFTSIPRQLL